MISKSRTRFLRVSDPSRQCDKLSGELYAALMGCRSKALLYVCTSCRKKGSIVNRLNAYEVDCARAHEQLLASAQTIDQLREQVAELKSDKRALQAKRESGGRDV